MAGRPEKFKPEQVAAALTETKGMVTLAARRLGCDLVTLYRYLEKYPEVKQAREEANAQMGDTVELALYDEAVNKRNIAALIFLAKTKFKERGYVERTEVTGKDGGAVEVDVSGSRDKLASLLARQSPESGAGADTSAAE